MTLYRQQVYKHQSSSPVPGYQRIKKVVEAEGMLSGIRIDGIIIHLVLSTRSFHRRKRLGKLIFGLGRRLSRSPKSRSVAFVALLLTSISARRSPIHFPGNIFKKRDSRYAYIYWLPKFLSTQSNLFITSFQRHRGIHHPKLSSSNLK